MPAQYYTESGRSSLPGLGLGLLVGATVGAVLGFVYAYAVLYIPLVVIRFLFTLGFGALAGLFAAGLPLRLGKIRNGRVRLLATLLVVLFAWYVSWVVWVWALLRRADVTGVNLLALALQPDVLWQAVLRINEVGAWRLRSVTTTGVVLWGVWAVEAAVIVGLGTLLGVVGSGAEPFCESCEAWCQKAEIGRVAAGDEGELQRRMEAKDTGYLEQVGAPAADAAHWTRLDLWTCPRCSKTNALDATAISVTVDKEGKNLESQRTVFGKLLVSKDEAERLRATGQRLAGARTDI